MWPNTGFDISLDSGSKDQGREDREQGPGGIGTWGKNQGEWGQGKFNLPPPHGDGTVFPPLL